MMDLEGDLTDSSVDEEYSQIKYVKARVAKGDFSSEEEEAVLSLLRGKKQFKKRGVPTVKQEEEEESAEECGLISHDGNDCEGEVAGVGELHSTHWGKLQQGRAGALPEVVNNEGEEKKKKEGQNIAGALTEGVNKEEKEEQDIAGALPEVVNKEEEEEEEEEQGAGGSLSEVVNYEELRAELLRSAHRLQRLGTKRAKGIDRKSLRLQVEVVRTLKTPPAVHKTCLTKLARKQNELKLVQKQIKQIEEDMEKELVLTEKDWEAARSYLLGAKVPAKHRDAQVHGKRRQRPCPVVGCAGRALNINRHLSQCHQHLTVADRKQLILKVAQLKELAKHREEEEAMISPVENKNRNKKSRPHYECQQHVSDADGVKTFFEVFQDYQETYTILKDVTIDKRVRLLRTCLVGGEGETLGVKDFNKNLIVQRLIKAVGTGGIVENKARYTSASYCRMLLDSLQKCIEFMMTTCKQQYKLPTNEGNLCINRLKRHSIAYRKQERSERYSVELRKEKSLLSMSQLKIIVEGGRTTRILEKARKVLRGEVEVPQQFKAFVSLRDVLIFIMIVRSLRRSMEFTEFTLEEFSERKLLEDKEGKKKVSMFIKCHKTGYSKPCNVTLSVEESEALEAYVEKYRPLVSPCSQKRCLVFTTRVGKVTQPSTSECCKKLTISSILKITNRVARHCGINERMGTRRIRRSQITAVLDAHDDPAIRNALAIQASHSVTTAERYYDFSDHTKKGQLMYKTLESVMVGQKRIQEGIDNPDDIPIEASGLPETRPVDRETTVDPAPSDPTVCQRLTAEVHAVRSCVSSGSGVTVLTSTESGVTGEAPSQLVYREATMDPAAPFASSAPVSVVSCASSSTGSGVTGEAPSPASIDSNRENGVGSEIVSVASAPAIGTLQSCGRFEPSNRVKKEFYKPSHIHFRFPSLMQDVRQEAMKFPKGRNGKCSVDWVMLHQSLCLKSRRYRKITPKQLKRLYQSEKKTKH
ncbi:hypothetical protein Pcinc_007104 [Petrolisthes cinctipes]|uniref:Uncharacterized protein n=1 Tax=Petrolisthes cinctipes TaxID=88211 RepID=A0AAE1G941_PETCI|nr:hypothetical protein Pcinc_007104 [Petrolisthes cinctipes]